MKKCWPKLDRFLEIEKIWARLTDWFVFNCQSSSINFDFRYNADSYDEALTKAQEALEIEEKQLGVRDEQMAELYRVLVYISAQVKIANFVKLQDFSKNNLFMLF